GAQARGDRLDARPTPLELLAAERAQRRITGIDPETQDMDLELPPGAGQFHARHEADALLPAGRLGLGQSLERVVIGQGEQPDAACRGEAYQLGRSQRAVRAAAVRVQVDAAGPLCR